MTSLAAETNPLWPRLTRARLLALGLLTAFCAPFVLAVDHPDAPDYVAAFEQRAQPFADALYEARDAAANAAYSAFLDRELDLAYRELLTRVDAEARPKLQASQRAWLAFYEAELAFIAGNWTPRNFGSSSALSRADYRADLVKARILTLLNYLKNYPPR